MLFVCVFALFLLYLYRTHVPLLRLFLKPAVEKLKKKLLKLFRNGNKLFSHDESLIPKYQVINTEGSTNK